MARTQNRSNKQPVDPIDYLGLPYSRVVIPEEDGTFRGEIFEFPGCIATGETEAEALASLKDVALSWLEASLAKGQVIPEPIENVEFSGKLVLRLPKSLHKKSARAAERDGVSLNHFIVSSLAEHVGIISAFRPATSMTHVVVMPSYFSSVSRGEVPRQTLTGPTRADLADLAIFHPSGLLELTNA